MDPADYATQAEMGFRNAAIKRQQDQAAADNAAKPITIDGVICCCDCLEPIEPERLQARPNAARCIDCKTIWEKKNR